MLFEDGGDLEELLSMLFVDDEDRGDLLDRLSAVGGHCIRLKMKEIVSFCRWRGWKR